MTDAGVYVRFADRGKVDPAGKVINQITRSFLQKPAGAAGSAAASPK